MPKDLPSNIAATSVKQDSIISALTTKYANRVDLFSSTIIYVGNAAIGSSAGSAVWRIKKIETIGTEDITTWAGTGLFDQVWSNRAALTYA